MYTGYERLANGIILQAVDDYRKARKDLKLNIHNHEARKILNDCERFFRPEWFGVLTWTIVNKVDRKNRKIN